MDVNFTQPWLPLWGRPQVSPHTESSACRALAQVLAQTTKEWEAGKCGAFCLSGAFRLPEAFHTATDPVPETAQVPLLVGGAEVQRSEVAGPPAADRQ